MNIYEITFFNNALRPCFVLAKNPRDAEGIAVAQTMKVYDDKFTVESIKLIASENGSFSSEHRKTPPLLIVEDGV